MPSAGWLTNNLRSLLVALEDAKSMIEVHIEVMPGEGPLPE